MAHLELTLLILADMMECKTANSNKQRPIIE